MSTEVRQTSAPYPVSQGIPIRVTILLVKFAVECVELCFRQRGRQRCIVRRNVRRTITIADERG